MNDITKDKVHNIFKELQETLLYLFIRWNDEKQYEDWDNYHAHIKETFEKYVNSNNISNAFFVKSLKRPFGLSFDFEGWRVKMSINSKTYKWEAKKI